MKKQIIDQSAHFVVGGLITAALVFLGLPQVLSLVGLMVAAYIREVIQHGRWDVGKGSAIDLWFWFVGGCVGIKTASEILA